MINWKYIVATLVLVQVMLFQVISSKAQTKYDIYLADSIIEHDFVLKELPAFIDTTNQLTFNSILNNYSNLFRIDTTYTKNDYDVNSTYWVKLNIKNNPQSQRIWVIEFFDQTIDSISIFNPTSDGFYQESKMGDQLLFSQRSLKHKNFLYVIDNKDDTISSYYFKINSTNRADVRIVVRSLNRFIYYSLNEYFIFGFFYGLIFIISVYNLLLFIAIKERKYILYTFYLLSVAIYAMCTDGIAFQYLWPNHPIWNQYASGISIFMVIIFALLFTKLFLNTKKIASGIDTLLKITIIARVFLFLYAIFFSTETFDNRFIEILPISVMLFSSVVIRNKGYKPARFMVIAYGLLMIGIIIKSLVYAGLFPFSITTNYSLRIGFILEMLFLTIALGDRVRILKENRDQALREIIKEHEINSKLLDKVNRELESKVTERTIELDKKNHLLEDSNDKLISQAKEIHQINNVLDLDNWKLKNNLKNVVQDRLFNKYLTYDEFKSVFPDHLACYRYLEKSKWADIYACKKCNNKKYSSAAASFARRCSKCGYNESITAFTIFHGIKFPIEKAFYITFRVTRGRKDFTLDELAQTLDLRKNTVWKFKQKVEQVIKNDPRQRDNYQIMDEFVPDAKD